MTDVHDIKVTATKVHRVLLSSLSFQYNVLPDSCISSVCPFHRISSFRLERFSTLRHLSVSEQQRMGFNAGSADTLLAVDTRYRFQLAFL